MFLNVSRLWTCYPVPKLELGNEQNRKIRHFGMDAEIQAMDGNKSVVQMFDSGIEVCGSKATLNSLPHRGRVGVGANQMKLNFRRPL